MAVIRHVPADFPTIQSALSASGFGDVVLVAPGTYFENLTISPVQNGVVLRSESGPEVTTIDGQQLDRVFRCFGVGPGTAIEGFSIVHGRVGANDVGAGLYLAGAHLRLENNIVRDNQGAAGAGLFVDFSSPQIIDNQILDNHALATGGGIQVTRNAHPFISRNIVAFNGLGDGIHVDDLESTVSLNCNDLWENAPANYAGLPDQTGMNGNISDDPLFCNLLARDLTIDETSPCAAANSPVGCGLIGAREVGCGAIAVEAATWGGIKARHLPERRLPVAPKSAEDVTAGN